MTADDNSPTFIVTAGRVHLPGDPEYDRLIKEDEAMRDAILVERENRARQFRAGMTFGIVLGVLIYAAINLIVWGLAR